MGIILSNIFFIIKKKLAMLRWEQPGSSASGFYRRMYARAAPTKSKEIEQAAASVLYVQRHLSPLLPSVIPQAATAS
jgi:hypothetical protein